MATSPKTNLMSTTSAQTETPVDLKTAQRTAEISAIKAELQTAYDSMTTDSSIPANKRAAAKAELVKSIKANADLMAALDGWLPGTVTATSQSRTLVNSLAARLAALS